jgi:uncharacterized protein (TIGR03437 family)
MRFFTIPLLISVIRCFVFGQTSQIYTIDTIAGNGIQGAGGDNGPAASAQLNGPRGVAVDAAGNVYIADYLNNRVRKVSNGVITTVAAGGMGFADGPVLPQGVAVDSAGNLYIADTGNHIVRKISSGVMTTVAGNGTIGFGGEGDNGPATSSQLSLPCAVAIDSAGNLFIADVGAHRVRRVSNGIITTVAGGGSIREPNNVPATSAYLGTPSGVAVVSAGNVYIADALPTNIYKVSNGVLTRIGPTAGDAVSPIGIAVDPIGNLYFTDLFGHVFKIANGVIAQIAGNGCCFGGDGGLAANAQFHEPHGIAVDSGGRVYVADSANNRIRILIPSAQASLPSIRAVTNAASNLPGAISPGEIIVLYGSSLGPSELVQAVPCSNCYYPTLLAGAMVSVNGTAAPMIYASATQTAAIVPYAIGGSSARVTITYQGETSGDYSVLLMTSAPGIFTHGSTGQGQAAAINQDGVTLNSAGTPAMSGDIISLYATGEGQTVPAGVDGKPTSVPYPYPNLLVTAQVGGQVARVTYAGGAPGLVAGLMQANVQIPTGIQTGSAVPVVIRVGENFSQVGVTIAVR